MYPYVPIPLVVIAIPMPSWCFNKPKSATFTYERETKPQIGQIVFFTSSTQMTNPHHTTSTKEKWLLVDQIIDRIIDRIMASWSKGIMWTYHKVFVEKEVGGFDVSMHNGRVCKGVEVKETLRSPLRNLESVVKAHRYCLVGWTCNSRYRKNVNLYWLSHSGKRGKQSVWRKGGGRTWFGM